MYNSLGAWNVKELNQCGQLENLKQEIKRLNINILGLSGQRSTAHHLHTRLCKWFAKQGLRDKAKGQTLLRATKKQEILEKNIIVHVLKGLGA